MRRQMHRHECQLENEKNDEAIWADIDAYDVLTANYWPTDEMLRKWRQSPKMKAVLFWKLRKPAQDSRELPDLSIPNIPFEQILTDWDAKQGKDSEPNVCALCATRKFRAKYKYKEMDPFGKSLKWCRISHAELNQMNPTLREARHLVTINDITFQVASQGVIKKNGVKKFIVCNRCHGTLQNATKSNNPPEGTLAYYDMGRIPKRLKLLKLSWAEKIAISTVVQTLRLRSIVFLKYNVQIYKLTFGYNVILWPNPILFISSLAIYFNCAAVHNQYLSPPLICFQSI